MPQRKIRKPPLHAITMDVISPHKPNMAMTTKEKVVWLYEQTARVDNAERALVAAKKQRVAEYDERLRKLRDLSDALFVKRTDEQQQELFQPDEMISPTLERLLANPLHGLD